MDSSALQMLAFGALAALANILGGLILFPSIIHKNYRKWLKYLLAIGAGFMLAVTFFEILPKTILLWQQSHPERTDDLSVPMVLLLGGYLLTQFFEHTIAPHFHLGEEVPHDTLISLKTAYSGVGGILIHALFDGVAIAAASQIDPTVGFLVFIAVLLHKFPEGFTIGSLIVAAGRGVREVVIAASLIGGTTFLGVLLYYFAGNSLGFSAVYALPLASGITLYVAASDLVPEINHHGGRRGLVSLALFAGVALFFVINLGVHEWAAH